jgi:hypothetical protein
MTVVPPEVTIIGALVLFVEVIMHSNEYALFVPGAIAIVTGVEELDELTTNVVSALAVPVIRIKAKIIFFIAKLL